jgi:hypothetical protein
MKYDVEMGSSPMIQIPSFIKTGSSGIQKLIMGWNMQSHRKYDDLIILLLFFANKVSRLKGDRKHPKFSYLLLGSHESERKVDSVYQMSACDIIGNTVPSNRGILLRFYYDVIFPLQYVSFFCGVGLNPPYVPFSGPLGSGSLGLFVSSPLGPYKSQHCGRIGLLYIPRMIHEGNCGVIGGANDHCRGNRSTRRKPAPAPLCPTTNPT